MTVPQFVLKGQSRNYPILITNLSIMVMEQETGLRLPKLFQHVGRASLAIGKKGKAKAEAIEDLAMEVGMTEILALLLAGLEGFRSKFKTRTQPYTLEEASDCLSDCGGIPGVQDPLAACFSAYFPSAMGVSIEDDAGNGAGKKKKAKRKSKTSRRTSKSS
jgi:hypothetical protein